MTDSTGFSISGRDLLTDFQDVQKSVQIILTTRIGSLVMLRDFGSDLPDLIDRKMEEHNILLVYAATALALRRAWLASCGYRRADL